MSLRSQKHGQCKPQLRILFVSVVIIALFLTPASMGSVSAHLQPIGDAHQEIHLLRVEHYLYLKAADDITTFHLTFVFPSVYGYQVPVFLELHNDTNATIQKYTIENHTNEPNLVVNFTLGPMFYGETHLVHFSCWAFVQNHSFEDLPASVDFPSEDQLPNATTTWLISTPVVQADSTLIYVRARLLQSIDENVITYATRVAWFIKNHRYGLFLLQLHFKVFLPQDALTTLFFNGDNVGRSHLACALFRSLGIPARVVLAHNDQGFWTQMHYMVEYYVPGYGWVLLDSTKGETPYATNRQVINRICYPEDEHDTKVDYIFPLMFGEERWLWIDSTLVKPYYVDCVQGSRSQMFNEGFTVENTAVVDEAMLLTKNVFEQYKQYLGTSLTGENLQHFTEAVNSQQLAVLRFATYHDLNNYMFLMQYAYSHYQQITM